MKDRKEQEHVPEWLRLVQIVEINKGMDWANAPIPSIALTRERIEKFKDLLLKKGKKPCCEKTQHLYLVVEYLGREFLLECVETNIDYHPGRLGVAVLSARAAERMGVEVCMALRFLRMEMHCEGGAETAKLILSKDNKQKQTAGAVAAATPIYKNIIKDIEAILDREKF